MSIFARRVWREALLLLCLVFVGAVLTPAQAAMCKQYGGTSDCVPLKVGPWTYRDYTAWDEVANGWFQYTSEEEAFTAMEAQWREKYPCKFEVGAAMGWATAEEPMGDHCSTGTWWPRYGWGGHENGSHKCWEATYRGKYSDGMCVTSDSHTKLQMYSRRDITCPVGTYGPTQDSNYTLCAVRYYLSIPRLPPQDCPPVAPSCERGNPIDAATGAKRQSEMDYQGTAEGTLVFKRSYDSRNAGWLPNYGQKLAPQYSPPPFDPALKLTSSAYFTPKDACQSGWNELRGKAGYFRGTTALYSGGSCQIRRGTTTIATAPIHLANGAPPSIEPVSFEVRRANGAMLDFFPAGGGAATAAADITGSLEITAEGYRYVDGGLVEQYDSAGRLQSITRQGRTETLGYDGSGRLAQVTDYAGRSLQLGYDASGRLATLTDPAGGQHQYGYDAIGNLGSVSYPDGRTRQYHYENATFKNALTGISDNGVRYASWTYDSNGRAITSEHAGGADRITVTYNADGSAKITDVFNGTETLQFTAAPSTAARVTSITRSCNGCSGSPAATSYNASGFVISRTDHAGRLTTYTRDSRGRELSRTEASGTAEARTLTTQWHPQFDLPLQIDAPGRRTQYSYDSQGHETSVSITDLATNEVRITTRSYNAAGLLETVDGPLPGAVDVTSYTYNAQHNLGTVTNALGHVTTITQHDAHGKPLRIVDPNGLETILTYDARQRLDTRTTAGETTDFDYDGAGQLAKVTMPDGSWIEYTYDPAHRLTDIEDQDNNRIHYTLDLVGNRTAEDVYDPSNVLRRTQTRVYDALSQLKEVQGANGQSTVYGYDANGNNTSDTVAGSFVTGRQYDTLNRLFKVTDAANGITEYGYNALDQLTSVTDPRSKITTYTVNAFGDVTQLQSPDTGTTVSTYDSAGNLATRTDAKGQLATYSYDALNRLTQVVYTGGPTLTYSYDQGTYGEGRLTGTTDASGSTSWTYDAQGRITGKSQAVGGQTLSTGYSYDSAGQLTRVTLPSGRVVRYEWSSGKVVNVFVDNGAITGAQVAVGMTHQPFGPPTSWRFGNGELIERTYDLDGRLSSHALGSLGYDTASRVSSLVQDNRSALQGSKTYGYDALDRLTRYEDVASSIDYSYDANGNRTQQVGAGTNVSYSIDPASNRISQIDVGTAAATYQYDANGSLTDDGIHRYAYDAAGRLRSAGAGTYSYNGLGQRVQKVVTDTVSSGLQPLQQALSTTTLFAYDEAGHLIGEYDGNGSLIQETVWLGDLPMAVLKPEGNYYIHADHLNSPRQIDNSTQQAVWTWDTITFGANTPSQPPAGTSTNFQYNLRFAGQYYDAETGLFQNWHRDYSPTGGRYIQSDPIGLFGGINTYAYVGSNPISYIDPWGLVKIPGIPGADGETSVHANPGPDATDYRPEHGPDHIHLGKNDGPRVRTSDFKPFSEEDARKLSRKQKQFCENIGEESKDLIRKRQRQIFQHGRVLLQLQAGGLLSISAACRADPGWCLEQIESGGLP